MRAITIKSPWWELILSGKKTIETRTWTTRPGPLLICAGAPVGCTVCEVDVINVRPMTPDDEVAAHVPYRPELFAWEMSAPRPVKSQPVRGMPGIFKVEPQ